MTRFLDRGLLLLVSSGTFSFLFLEDVFFDLVDGREGFLGCTFLTGTGSCSLMSTSDTCSAAATDVSVCLATRGFRTGVSKP